MTNQTSEEILTIDDLCEILHIGKNAAYELLNDGSIRAFRIGRVWKIPRMAISEYIASFGYYANSKKKINKRTSYIP